MICFDIPLFDFGIDEYVFRRQHVFNLDCVWIGALDYFGVIFIDAWILELPYEVFAVRLLCSIVSNAINLVSHSDGPILLSRYRVIF